MRLYRRRRPAGQARVPTENLDLGPVVCRLGPNREVWDCSGICIATTWPTPELNGWDRAEWPTDRHDAPIAPLDLSIGHTLEFRASGTGRVAYASVAAVRSDSVVVLLSAEPDAASHVSAELYSWWRHSQLEQAARQYDN